jgi:hypothetical protein
MSESEMQAELERLRAENAQFKSKDKGGLTFGHGEIEVSVHHPREASPFTQHHIQTYASSPSATSTIRP